MVVEILVHEGEGTCKNCEGPIRKLGTSGSSGWWHVIDGIRYQFHCPGAPVAEPVEES